MYYALIIDGKVDAIIVAEENYILSRIFAYQFIVRLPNYEAGPSPGPGWDYADGIFSTIDADPINIGIENQVEQL